VPPEPYRFTRKSGVHLTETMLDAEAPTGFQTPAGALRSNVVLEFDDAVRTDEYRSGAGATGVLPAPRVNYKDTDRGVNGRASERARTMGYEVTHIDDLPVTDLSEMDEVPPDLDIQPVGDVLGLSEMRATVWRFEPGEEIQYHAHLEQEELYYVLEGEFSLKLGRSGEAEYVEAGPGTFWVAKPEVGHGHRYVGDDEGRVLSIGAPPVEDPGRDPHALDDE
jgi:quercetin dioxygenase-like cupin family protein